MRFLHVEHLMPQPQKCVGGRGSGPDPAGGAYSSPPDSLARFERGDLRRVRKGGDGREGRDGFVSVLCHTAFNISIKYYVRKGEGLRRKELKGKGKGLGRKEDVGMKMEGGGGDSRIRVLPV